MALFASTMPRALAQTTDASPWQANRELVTKLSEKQPEFIYEEDKVPEFDLPPVLESSTESPQHWTSVTRPKLLQQFRDHVYGNRPDTKHSVSTRQVKTVSNAFDGKATGHQMEMTVSIGDRQFSFPFVLMTPNQSKQPTPAVVFINNRSQLSLDDVVAESDTFWPARTLIERGYATASFFTSDVDPDDKDRYSDSIRSFFANGEFPSQKSWGSLSAWGWAASRMLEQLAAQPSVDADRIAVVGHSRGGKTALWAAAEDDRFAAVHSNESGCGGAALSRRQFGESVARITRVFPHWFCRAFTAYSDNESELPVDQHQLIAILAPRGVYISSADEDLWADPRGEYLALVHSAPAFELLGQAAITQTSMPPIDQQRVRGKTGYHVRSGPHNLTPFDWDMFLDFTDTLFVR
ncbi:prolyl oligopeptidase family serine peptidase [Rubripirellula amarantea]|nr:prolyl oligopeptidase family serine peptidase [Rubripirellula amarantea]